MFRHVRKLRLTCAREADAAHGRVLLEDALRTASLGDETEFIVVRRLNLGHLSPRATATDWSRTLETTCQEILPTAVRYDRPGAARASAVSFPHRHEPWFAMAERTATGRPHAEWFWRPALPGWTPMLSAHDTLRLCFRTLASLGGLSPTLTAGLRLKRQGALPAMLRCLQTSDFHELRRELALLGSPASRKPGRPMTDAEAQFAAFWGVADLRTRWLAAVAATGRADGPAAPGRKAEPPAPLLHQVILRETGPASYPVSHDSREDAASGDTPRPSDRFSTRAGGLFFVLPLLLRAGFVDHLSVLSEMDRAVLPWQVLRSIVRLARIPENDPLAIALADTPPADGPLAGWLLALNRLSLKCCRLTLRELVTRPALVTLSPTHVDLFFYSSEANPRLRRAALDLDPGWVPWLSRVITYHFNRTD